MAYAGVVEMEWGLPLELSDPLPTPTSNPDPQAPPPPDQGMGLWRWRRLDRAGAHQPYEEPGLYTVTLTVGNLFGSHTLSETNYITIIDREKIYLPLVMRGAP